MAYIFREVGSAACSYPLGHSSLPGHMPQASRLKMQQLLWGDKGRAGIHAVAYLNHLFQSVGFNFLYSLVLYIVYQTV